MKIVIKPSQPPPVISKFCHLSEDAQKVMTAIYRQYDQQKERIMMSQMDRQVSQGPSRYYQSLYRSKFGCDPMSASQCIKAATNSQAISSELRSPNNSGGSLNNSDATECDRNTNQYKSNYNGYQISQIVDAPTTAKCKNRGSPDMKTSKSFRKPLVPNGKPHIGERSHESSSMSNERRQSESIGEYRYRNENCSKMQNKGLLNESLEQMEECSLNNSSSISSEHLQQGDTVCRKLKDLTNNTVVETNERVDNHTNYKNISESVGDITTTDTSSQESLPLSLSPSLFPNLEIAERDSKAEKQSEKITLNIPNTVRVSAETSHQMDSPTMARTDLVEKKETDTGNVQEFMLNKNRIFNTKSFQCTETKKSVGQPSTSVDLQFETMDKSIDNSKMNNSSGKDSLASDAQKNKQCSISKRLLEHKQIRREIEEKENENKHPALVNTDKKNKRKISSFFAPYKKTKVSEEKVEKQLLPARNVNTIDITSINTEQPRSDLIQRVNSSKEILITIVYEDSQNQLREMNKRKPQNYKPRATDQIRSLSICLSDNDSTQKKAETFSKIYSIPVDINSSSSNWTRSFCDAILNCSARKICYGAKEWFITLIQHIYQESKVVIGDWTVLDPQIAAWLLDPDNPPTSFEDCLKSVNLVQEKKDVIDCCELLTEDFALLGTLMGRLYQKLQARELWDLFYCVETKLVPLLAFMECQKVNIDTDKLMMFSDVLKRKLQKLEQKAHESVGHAFLINSPAQLRQVLFEELRLDTKLPHKMKLAKTSVGHQISTSETVLQQLVELHPLPALILEYRQFQKLKSTYLDGIMSCVQNGCLTTHWDQASAATGRLSSYQPNVQAIPKTPILVTNYKDNFIIDKENSDTLEIFARDIFRSQKDWSFLAADFQQIELRILAHLADDDILLQIFKNQTDSDIFIELTSQWLGKAVVDITSSEREQTKRIVYSVMYGAGKEKLAEYLKISADNAKAIMNSFLVRFPAINQFSKKCTEFCLQHGYTSTIFKRKRLIPNIRHKSPPLRAQAERQAINFCVQGSAADLCKAAMLQIEQTLRNHKHLRTRQLFQIHDELLLEVHDDDINAVKSIVKSVMEDSKTLCGSVVELKVPIKVSISKGKTWGHMSPL